MTRHTSSALSTVLKDFQPVVRDFAQLLWVTFRRLSTPRTIAHGRALLQRHIHCKTLSQRGLHDTSGQSANKHRLCYEDARRTLLPRGTASSQTGVARTYAHHLGVPASL